MIWELHPQSDRYKPEVFEKYFEGAIESGGALAVIDRATRRVIGCTRYCNLKQGESEIEIGWTFLERAFWGGGVNSEMKSLMLDHAFRFVERVVFVIGEENRRSRKAVEKIGGTLFRDAEHIQAVRRFPSSCTPSPARHTSSRAAPQPPHWASALYDHIPQARCLLATPACSRCFEHPGCWGEG